MKIDKQIDPLGDERLEGGVKGASRDGDMKQDAGAIWWECLLEIFKLPPKGKTLDRLQVCFLVQY